ncbi:hypothetical protein V500_05733 [Pseudogymnoascus sp. VKM F-4518 (FW-2643)]|nr:hypothetical protein V500_05733 [Pseudogymnoascus sp. VKM F-4518 (FW-2643)]
MSKPKKNETIQKTKIKQLKTRLRSAVKEIHKLKQWNRALQRIKSPPRAFKYRPRIVKILEVKTFHRFPDHPVKLHLKPPPRPLTFNPRNPKPLHHVFQTHFQIRLKSRPRPQIIKPPELKEFHYFPYLPYEIRVPIWKLAVDAVPGRGVFLRVDPLAYHEYDSQRWAEMSSSTEIPALLHTCQLSRMLARERWELCMAAYPGGVKKVYIDVMSDSVCFPSLTLLWHWQRRGDLREVQWLASGGKLQVSTEGDGRGLIGLDFSASGAGHYYSGYES